MRMSVVEISILISNVGAAQNLVVAHHAPARHFQCQFQHLLRFFLMATLKQQSLAASHQVEVLAFHLFDFVFVGHFS